MIASLAIAVSVLLESSQDPGLHAQPQRSPDFSRTSKFHFQRHPQFGRTEPIKFEPNKFTFCRIQYRNNGRWGRGGWRTDYPESDYNFSLRLSQLTTIEVNRDEHGEIQYVHLPLTDPQLFNYPWIYMLEVGALSFSEEERYWLREYLLRGGFLFVDDFWGVREWENWYYEINQVFPEPEYEMFEIPIDHEIFHCVFELEEMPQVPSINHVQNWIRYGITWEREDAKEAKLWGIKDKNDRLMVVVAHNTDLGDGWEREGVSPVYFEEFSAKKAYPLGINIVVYAMTH